MKKQFILTIAGVLTLQTAVAADAPSRFSQISEKGIELQQEKVATLNDLLSQLDSVLVQTQTNIKERADSGSIINGTALIGAGLGIALSIAGRAIDPRALDIGIGLGAIATGVSTLLSVVGDFVKDDADTTQALAAVKAVTKEVNARMKEASDTTEVASLAELKASLKKLKTSLSGYQKSEDRKDLIKIATEVVQAAGVVITFTAGGDGRQLILGSVISSVGTLAQLINYMSADQVENVLAALEKTRTEVATAQASVQ